MNNVTRSEAIQRFLQREGSIFANKYRHGFEAQVNVYRTDADCDVKGFNYRTCIETKEGFQYTGDEKHAYPFEYFADVIGISGWNPREFKSYGVGFDFDAVANHAGTGTHNLDQVLEAVSKLPYVTIVRSKSGLGCHLWVWFAEPIETKTRAEHKAVARAALAKMSFDSNYHLEGELDVFGGNMWIWSKDANEENQGLTLVKKGTLLDTDLDWRPHLDVVKKNRRRVAICDSDPDFDYPRERLDSEHRRVIDDLVKTGFTTLWNEDHHCLVTHAHALGLIDHKGIYETNSPGNDQVKPNVFMFPAPDGAWRVYHFDNGRSEAKTWTTGEWTWCNYNTTPTLEDMARACDAQILPSTTMQGTIFANVESATKGLRAFDVELSFPSFATDRDITLKIKNGKSLLEFQRFDDIDDTTEAKKLGWSKQRGIWAKTINIESKPSRPNYAAMARGRVRYVSENGEGKQSYAMTNQGWESRPEGKIKDQLAYGGIQGGLQQELLGWCSEHPYRSVSIPFGPEYPGNRTWNRESAQLTVQPADRSGPTPYWDKVTGHQGEGLDDAVIDNDLCQELGITTGKDYIEQWIANVIREPHRRLPILAMYSPEQDTGKSILHEGLEAITNTKGVVQADKALSNPRGFNVELKGAPFCVIEETNLAKHPDAYDRLKAWNTNLTVANEEKGESVDKVKNYMHYLMCVNHRHYIPIEPGDTRFVLWRVSPIKSDDMIPKAILMAQLVKEAPFFLHRLYQLDIDTIVDRHTLPVLMTLEKQEAMEDARFEEFPLKGLQLRLAQAIQDLPKPLNATAAELNERLGDWDGQQRTKKDSARAKSLGRNIQYIEPYLPEYFRTKIEIDNTGRVNQYKIASA